MRRDWRHYHLVLVLHELSLPSKPALQSTLSFFLPPHRALIADQNSIPTFLNDKESCLPLPPSDPSYAEPTFACLFLQILKSSYLSIHLYIHSSFHPPIHPSSIGRKAPPSIMNSYSLIIHPSVRRSVSIHQIIRAILRNARLVSLLAFLQSERGRGSK